MWNDADVAARELSQAPGTAYIHPFDHSDLWEGDLSTLFTNIHFVVAFAGHASLTAELASSPEFDAKSNASPPSVVICSVGGGGLLAGLCQGLVDVKSLRFFISLVFLLLRLIIT